MERPREHRKHDMNKNIPWQRRNEIATQINQMPDCNEKTICKLYFIEDMSTTDIYYYCVNNLLMSRNHKPYSRRRIQQIIAETVPDYNLYQKHTKKNASRKQHAAIRNKKERTFCGKCGRKDCLELHHMTPYFLGGTDAEENLIWLCKECHSAVTRYQQSNWSDDWYKRK